MKPLFEVTCSFCRGQINVHKDAYYSRTMPDGKKFFWHNDVRIADCYTRAKEMTEDELADLNRSVSAARSVH